MTAEQPGLSDALYKSLDEALKWEVTYAVTFAVEQAKKELDHRIPELVAGLLVRVRKNVSFENFGQELVVKIRWEDVRKGI